MLSLFCMVVCVVAQPTNKAVHAVATPQIKLFLISFIDRNWIVERFQTITSESNSGGDLRTVQNSVETEIGIPKVTAECPVTNFSKDAPSPVKPDHGLDFPH